MTPALRWAAMRAILMVRVKVTRLQTVPTKLPADVTFTCPNQGTTL